MENLLDLLAYTIERGKVDRHSVFPKDMQQKDGAVELTKQAIEDGIPAGTILNEGLLKGMEKVGVKFKNGEYFIPDVLVASKAMKGSMELLKPFFKSGEIKFKGSIILGTVAGDLHDIGKNLVGMVLEGGGWQVLDLGVDVNSDKFIRSIEESSVKVIGLSALLTSTMMNMKIIIEKVKKEFPDSRFIVGGAPLSPDYALEIGADAYSPDPQGALDFLNSITLK